MVSLCMFENLLKKEKKNDLKKSLWEQKIVRLCIYIEALKQWIFLLLQELYRPRHSRFTEGKTLMFYINEYREFNKQGLW